MKIVFFIENLRSGGKERRLLELIHFLKENTDYESYIVMLEEDIHYDYVYQWNIPITMMKRKGLRKDPRIFWHFYTFCRKIKPDIIHAWSYMNTFYALPTKFLLKIPLISSMITRAANHYKPWSFGMFIVKTNLYFSDVILSNSHAGLDAFHITSKKAQVIYNGVRFERFENIWDPVKIRKKFSIKSPLVIIMVASFTEYKDYDVFVDIAKNFAKMRNDTAFIAVGGDWLFDHIKERVRNENITNISLLGPQNDVESIISASDIGVLFSKVEEGISNSIIEYMALGKPVIATDSGGTKELVLDNKTGYLVSNEDLVQICDKLNFLLDNPDAREKMGLLGKQRIKNDFSIEKIGKQYLNLYERISK